MKKQKRTVLVGMGGWQLEPFNGIFYPTGARKGFRKLEYFSRYWDAVEVNATFYTNALTQRNSHQWLEDVSGNKNFMFSVKLYKGFTHSMDATQQDVTNVHRLLEPMAAEEKLIGLVMQFPYSFVNTEENREHLGKLSKAFGDFPLLVEVRHNSWNKPETLDFLSQNNLHLVNVDLPKIKKHMPFTDVAWGGIAYFRLMGRNAKHWDRPFPKDEGSKGSESDRYFYRYSEDELKEFAALIGKVRLNLDDAVVILHNDPKGHSLLNGFQLRHLLDPEEKIEVPENLARTYPELQKISVSRSGAPTLFEEGHE